MGEHASWEGRLWSRHVGWFLSILPHPTVSLFIFIALFLFQKSGLFFSETIHILIHICICMCMCRFFQVFSTSIYQLCNDTESLRYATISVLQDFQDDGVRYLELRTTPRAFPDSGISKEEYVTTVLETINDFTSDKQQNCPMSIFLILSIDRSNTASEAMEVVDLALKHRARGIVGVDLCGNPSKGDVSIFKDAFAKCKTHSLGITLHFAESAFSGSLTELETLLSFQPDRLGHVIHVPASIRDEIARRRLGLELCLSCNVHAKMIDGSFEDHHFGYYWNSTSCPVSLCVRAIYLVV